LLLVEAPWAWFHLFSVTFTAFIHNNDLLYAAGYAVIFWTEIIGLVVIPFLSNSYIRCFLVLLIVSAYALDKMFLDITSYALSLRMMRLIWLERQVGLDSFTWYLAYLVHDCFWVFGSGILLALPPRRNLAFKLRWSSIPITAFAVVAVITLYTGTQNFPPPFSIPAEFVMATGTNSVITSAANVEYDGPIIPLAMKIVLIVDENVRGDVLEINNSQANNTPFLASHRDELTNFGVAVSGANCSFLSRSMLKFGLRPDHFPELTFGLTSLKRPIGPTIRKYARYAGYRMVMIDGWPKAELYKDHEISSKWYFSATNAPTFMRDGFIANRLLQLLKEDAPSFIYVNKFGTHAPYGRAFPRDSDGAKPVSPQDDEKPAPGQDGDGTALLRAYNHALAWSVDEFFKKLLNQFDDQSVLLIHTSDHGQSLGDGKI
jgi:Sulfatase